MKGERHLKFVSTQEFEGFGIMPHVSQRFDGFGAESHDYKEFAGFGKFYSLSDE